MYLRDVSEGREARIIASDTGVCFTIYTGVLNIDGRDCFGIYRGFSWHLGRAVANGDWCYISEGQNTDGGKGRLESHYSSQSPLLVPHRI